MFLNLFFQRYNLAFIPILWFVLFSLLFLTVYPIPWPDEAHLGDPAHRLVRMGSLSSSLLLGQENHLFWVPPGYFFPLGLFFAIFGFGLEQHRIFSLLFGAAIIFLAYVITLIFTGQKRAAFILSLFIACDPFFLRYAKIGRMESLTAFLVLLSFFLFLKFHSHKSFRTLIAFGLVVACAGFMHPFGSFIAVGCFLGMMWWERELLSMKYIITIILLSVIPYGVWIMYGLSDGENFLVQIGWQWDRMLRKEILVHVVKFFYGYRYLPVLLFVYVIALFIVLSGRIRLQDNRLQYMAVCGMIFLVVAIRTAEPQHALYYIPFLAIASSVSICSLNDDRLQVPLLGKVLVVLFVVNGLLHAGYFGWKYGVEKRNETSYKWVSQEVVSNLVGAQTIILDGHPELSWEIKHTLPELRIIEPPFFKNEYLTEALTIADHIVMTRGFLVKEDELEIEVKIQTYQKYLSTLGKRAFFVAEVGAKSDWTFSARIYQLVNNPEFASIPNSN